jgi:shikimate dehydrogenase
LRRNGEFEPRGKAVVVLGAGGVARAVGFALVGEHVKKITLINRTRERAEQLAASLRMEAEAETTIEALPWNEIEISNAIVDCDLLVNCTSIGMKYSAAEGKSPVKAGLLSGDALVYDLVYNPIETPLLREVKKAGARTLGGLTMLVYQGAASFELWTGLEAPVELMLKEAEAALKE